MASSITHLPHIKNTQAGNNFYDPMHSAIYEVYFTLPNALRSTFKDDEAVLTEQVFSVSGLDALQKTVQAGSQRFFGVDVSFLNPTLESTYASVAFLMLRLNTIVISAYVFSSVGLRNDTSTPKNFCEPA